MAADIVYCYNLVTRMETVAVLSQVNNNKNCKNMPKYQTVTHVLSPLLRTTFFFLTLKFLRMPIRSVSE